jgi:hypothetical protein
VCTGSVGGDTGFSGSTASPRDANAPSNATTTTTTIINQIKHKSTTLYLHRDNPRQSRSPRRHRGRQTPQTDLHLARLEIYRKSPNKHNHISTPKINTANSRTIASSIV